MNLTFHGSNKDSFQRGPDRPAFLDSGEKRLARILLMLSRHRVEGAIRLGSREFGTYLGKRNRIAIAAPRKKVGPASPVLTGQTEDESGEIETTKCWSLGAMQRSAAKCYCLNVGTNQLLVSRELIGGKYQIFSTTGADFVLAYR